MRLRHYTSEPFEFDPTRKYQSPEGQRHAYKPRGLWVSVLGGDPDWPQWCRDNEFAHGCFTHTNRVQLYAKANVLMLGEPMELIEFTRKYGDDDYSPRSGDHMGYIDWPQVACEYDGIIITPYQWPCRLTLSWYYGWDCASGCIWNLDAIADVRPVKR